MGNSHYFGNYNDWLSRLSERITECRKQRSGVIDIASQVDSDYKAELAKSRLLSSQFIELSKKASFVAPAEDSEKLEWLNFLNKKVVVDLMLSLDAY